MKSQLKISVHKENADIAIINLSGEVDVANAVQVKEVALKLISEGAEQLIFDLSATDYMDSTGLGMLVGLQKRLRERNGEVRLVSLKSQVQRLFEITGLNQVFGIYNDSAAALKEVRA